jgi:SAM-dependent methyltransferase
MKAVPAAVRRKVGTLIYERGGIDTGGLVHLPIHDAERILYVASNRGTLRRALRATDVTDSDVFLDAGSGKGRILLEAARNYNFGRVVGVELVPELHETAQLNVEASRSQLRCPVELVQCDIVDYAIPDDVSVIFLHNPFRGEPFRVFLRGLASSLSRRDRPLTVVYYNPTELSALLGSGLFVLTEVVPPPRRQRHNFPFGWTVVAKSLEPAAAATPSPHS